MSDDGAEGPGTTLAPDEAFATIGNETRLEILRALGDTTDPLSFSDLHDRVDVRDSGQFNYHLEQLVGHFVGKTEAGYDLEPAGRRVVEAVLSGAVTETPRLARTRVEESCRYCGAPVEIDWQAGSIRMYCTSCPGTFARSRGGGEDTPEGYLGRLSLPPAGLDGRDPTELLRAAWTWSTLELMAVSAGLCPRCAATVDLSPRVCPDHDASDGLCETCDALHEVGLNVACTNCIYESGGVFAIRLLANTDLLDFLTDHGRNPVGGDAIHPVTSVQGNYDETVHSRDPFHATFTFSTDGETLALTVDEDLDVVEAVRKPA